ncbi:MAG: TonB-dependent receptor [Candidatus Kapabacteria bacterium]|nr:TonB-dependent receptor [Candidatus Kapabacteria bacterium]
MAQVSLEITVLNGTDKSPVVNTPVMLSNTDIGFKAQLQSNAQGKVRFTGLSTAGKYTVSAEATDNFRAAKITNIVLRTSFERSVNLVLTPTKEASLDAVSVESSRSVAQINTVNAEVSSTLSRRELEQIPIEARDMTRVLFRFPNVAPATGFYPENPNVSINGVNSLYTNYMIDGLDNNEQFLGGQRFAIPAGFTQDITVLTNNYSTEFGRSGNGIVNMTTRSGSNDLTGEAFYMYRPGRFLGDSADYLQRDLTGNLVRDGFMRHQAGFGLGGALVRDKAFFYVNAEYIHDLKSNALNVPQLGVSGTVPATNTFLYISGKLDYLWSDAFKSALRVNVGQVNVQRAGGGLDGGVTFPSAGNSQDRNSLNIALTNVYASGNLSAELNAQYSTFRWNYGRANNLNSPQVVVYDSTNQVVAVLGHPGYVFDSQQATLHIQPKVSIQADNHRLKFGGEIVSTDHGLFGGGNVNGNYQVRLTGAQQRALIASGRGTALLPTDLPADVRVIDYNVELQPRSYGANQTIFSVYAEDLWSVSSDLNITLGLRYDCDNLSQGAATQGDLNNIAPRFSFNYKLNERSVIRGGAGIFYDKIVYAIYSDALQQSTTSDGFKRQLQQLKDKGILPANADISRMTFEGNAVAFLDGSRTPIRFLQAPNGAALQEQRGGLSFGERRILNPNGYQNPMTQQYTLGYQYQLSDKWLFFTDFIHTRTDNLYFTRDLNAPAAYPIDPNNVVVRTQAQADATRPVQPVAGGAVRGITVTETAGQGRFYAASLNLLKDKGDDAYSFRVSYTLSRSENNTDDINFRAQDANRFDAEWGPSINDRTHLINAFGTYFFGEAFAVNLAILAQSGQPINFIPDARRYGTTDLNGDGQAFGDAYVGNSDRAPGESRNSGRLAWSSVIDLGLQYNLALGGTGRVEIRADVFNVLNTANVSGFSNNATQSNQIQVGGTAFQAKSFSPPRQFQFGVRYVF